MVIWGLSKQSNNFPEFKFVAVNRKNRLRACLRLLLPISGHVQFSWEETIET